MDDEKLMFCTLAVCFTHCSARLAARLPFPQGPWLSVSGRRASVAGAGA